MNFEEIYKLYEKHVCSNIDMTKLENSTNDILEYLLDKYREDKVVLPLQKRKVGFWLVMKLISVVNNPYYMEDIKENVKDAAISGFFIGYMFGISQHKKTTLEELIHPNRKIFRFQESFIIF